MSGDYISFSHRVSLALDGPEQYLRSTAVEFLTKPFRDQELLDAIQQAIERDRVVREQRAQLAELRTRHESLTPRERQVMALVMSGLLNKQIAGELGTARSPSSWIAEVMHKMRAGSVVGR